MHVRVCEGLWVHGWGGCAWMVGGCVGVCVGTPTRACVAGWVWGFHTQTPSSPVAHFLGATTFHAKGGANTKCTPENIFNLNAPKRTTNEGAL